MNEQFEQIMEALKDTNRISQQNLVHMKELYDLTDRALQLQIRMMGILND